MSRISMYQCPINVQNIFPIIRIQFDWYEKNVKNYTMIWVI